MPELIIIVLLPVPVNKCVIPAATASKFDVLTFNDFTSFGLIFLQ
jgi:hypothetical protein